MSGKHEVSVYRPVLNLGSDYFEAMCQLVGDCPSPDIEVETAPRLYLVSPDETAKLIDYKPELADAKSDALAYWLETCLPDTAQGMTRIIGGLSVRRQVSFNGHGYGRSSDSLTIGQDNRTVVSERRKLLSLLCVDGEQHDPSHTAGVLLAKHERRAHKPSRLRQIRAALTEMIVVPPVIELGEVVVENKHFRVDKAASNR